VSGPASAVATPRTVEDPDPREQAIARGMVVVVVLLGVLVTVGFLSLRGGSVSADEAESGMERMGLDELERRVQERPDDLVARLAIGHHHFDRSDYDLALVEYLRVLDQDPDHVRAMARAGWIAFEGGESALAERLVTEALERAPADPEALWFLAHIRMYGLREPAGAIPPLRALSSRGDLSDGFRAQVDRLLAEAQD
jgi:cytochrome c-type biogenesis protein CcmH/NrfG